MPDTLTTEPLGHLVSAADQAYLIVTDVLIYCIVYEYSNIHEPASVQKQVSSPSLLCIAVRYYTDITVIFCCYAVPMHKVKVAVCGNIVGRINEVTLRRAGLVLNWVTVRRYILSVFKQATLANSAWPSLRGLAQ